MSLRCLRSLVSIGYCGGGGGGSRKMLGYIRTASTKPPNVLVYTARSGSQVLDTYRSLFESVLEDNCYAIYSFEDRRRWQSAWSNNTVLVILASNPEQSDASALLGYLQHGGYCISFDGVSNWLPSNEDAFLSRSCDAVDGRWIRHVTSTGGILMRPSEGSAVQTRDLPLILAEYFQMRCRHPPSTASVERDPSLPPAHLIAANSDAEDEFFSADNPILKLKSMRVLFAGRGWLQDAHGSLNDPTCLTILREPSDRFQRDAYFRELKTTTLGRTLIYADAMPSTHTILEQGSPLQNGLVITARRQTSGRGRSGNVWLSPEGCAMFSLQMQFSLSSPLGKSLSLIQHITALSVVMSLKSLHKCQDLNIGLKWPNDIYADGAIKIGGVLVTTSITGSRVLVNIGCGLNLDNRVPTCSVNDMIENAGGQRLGLEKYLAIVCNQLEFLTELVCNGELEKVLDFYHTNWLHSNKEVTIMDGLTEKVATIVGIDEYGFLRVETGDGGICSASPDGNSFDMLNGLIAMK